MSNPNTEQTAMAKRRTVFTYHSKPHLDILEPSGQVEWTLIFPSNVDRDRAAAKYKRRGFRVVAERAHKVRS